MSEAISGNERDACLTIHTMSSSAKADDPVFREAIDQRLFQRDQLGTPQPRESSKSPWEIAKHRNGI
jgi:hypothetical protein